MPRWRWRSKTSGTIYRWLSSPNSTYDLSVGVSVRVSKKSKRERIYEEVGGPKSIIMAA